MARKTDTTLSDVVQKRRATLSSSSSSSSSVNQLADASIQTYMNQNNILTKRNLIYLSRITELENELNQSQEELNQANKEIERLKNMLTTFSSSVEGKLAENFNDILQYVKSLNDVQSSTSFRASTPILPDCHNPTCEITKSIAFEDDQSISRPRDTLVRDIPTSSELDLKLGRVFSSAGTDSVNENLLDRVTIPKASKTKSTPPPETQQSNKKPTKQFIVTLPVALDTQPRRPTRARKEVSYKPLALNKKMRRESAKLVDAVGENALINYTVDSKKRKVEVKSEYPSQSTHKRKPLASLNTNTASTTKTRKSVNLKSSGSDLAIFDFQEEAAIPNNRRYTTIG
ncbi:hypothetical protein G210_1199 [Candida maltosa Xu316]|uniref:Shugoshin N-terminal coiled-coil domain-containing protein n=1 Tax=Candida maltosa (strain Xu316) TaxID=1245528 RepID=M3K7C2_CANMX|nr:hypothetical protein G210_1199 [Candida maltosa Xu316]